MLTPSRDLKIFIRLLKEAKSYIPHIAGVFILNLCLVPLTILIPLPLKIVVDHVLGDRPVPGYLQFLSFESQQPSSARILLAAIVLLLGLALLRQAVELGAATLHAFTGSRLVLNFRAKLFRQVQRLSLKYHDTQGFSDPAFRIQYDAPAVQYVALDGIIPFLTSFLTVVSMIGVTASLDWTLALIALLITPAFFILLHLYKKPLRSKYHSLSHHESSALSVIHEVLSSVRVVKAFGREDYEHERYYKTANESVRAKIRVQMIQGSYNLLVGMTTAAGTAAVLYVGVQHVREGVLTLGQLLVIMTYLAQLYVPLRAMSTKSADIQSSFVGAERVFALLDRETDVVENPHAVAIKRSNGGITFEDVSFAYEKGQTVLDNVSFQVSPGQRVGIAGPTGSGKTTLISLLMRFYDPVSGSVQLDGKDLKEYRIADVRNQFALMLQESVLFSTTITENIAYGKPEASETQITDAAKAAHAHEFITRLPDGYQTKVGERGMKLSGGERQRIALARAFLKDAPILILDEPTSSVDNKTESLIMDALKSLMHGRTTFMIAHRLSTLEGCDLRLNLDHGRILVSEHSDESQKPDSKVNA